MAQKVLAECKHVEKKDRLDLLFDYTAYPYKVVDVEQCACESGWLKAHLVSFVSKGQTEQHILLTALGEDGKPLGQEFAEKLLNIPSSSIEGKEADAATAESQLSATYGAQRDTLTA